MLIPSELAPEWLASPNYPQRPVKSQEKAVLCESGLFSDPTRNAFPLRMTDDQRSQIRAPWWWRNYLSNVRSQLAICNRITAHGKRKIARLAIEQARAGTLPSVYGMALNIRLRARVANMEVGEWVNSQETV